MTFEYNKYNFFNNNLFSFVLPILSLLVDVFFEKTFFHNFQLMQNHKKKFVIKSIHSNSNFSSL